MRALTDTLTTSRALRVLAVLGLTLVLFAAAATPAFAADDGEKPGLLDINWWEVGITIAVFVILLIVLSKTAWGPILGALKKREETISKALDDAKAANEAAQAKIAEYDARLQTAKEEALAIAEEAKKDAEDIRARIRDEAQQEASDTVARAKREIEQASAKAWDGVVRDAASMSTMAAERIIGKQLDDAGHAALVAQVVAEFAKSKGGNA